MSSLELAEPDLADHRTDELSQACRARATTNRRSRREPESGWRWAHLERFGAQTTCEMVNLVDDDHPESIAQSIEVTIPALERHQRDLLDRALAISDDPERPAVPARELLSPSLEQGTCWTQDKGSRGRFGEDSDGHPRLAAPGWQYDDTATLERPKSKERILLVDAERRMRPRTGRTMERGGEPIHHRRAGKGVTAATRGICTVREMALRADAVLESPSRGSVLVIPEARYRLHDEAG